MHNGLKVKDTSGKICAELVHNGLKVKDTRRKAQVTRKDVDTLARVGVCLAKPYTLHLLVSPFNTWKVLQYLN